MKLTVKLSSEVVAKALQMVAKGFGLDVVDDVDTADLIIADDLREMLSILKKEKQVIQFLYRSPDEVAATGLKASYPDQFKVFRVIPNEDAEDCDSLIVYLLTLSKGETNEDPSS